MRNFLTTTFVPNPAKSIIWDGVNATQQDWIACAISDGTSCLAKFNLSFLTFKKCGSITIAPPAISHYSDTNLVDPRTARSPASPLVIWGCNETNPPPSAYDCPASLNMLDAGFGARGAFTQYETTVGLPVNNGGHVILFSKTIDQLSDMWYGYAFDINRGDILEITTWIRFQGTVPKASNNFGLGVRGQAPDNSFLSTTTRAETWYFIRWRNVISNTGTIGAGIILDSLPVSQIILLYDLRVNIYPNAMVKPVMVGTVKFSASVIGWEWCNPCKEGDLQQIGEFLDFTFNVKVRNNASVTVSANNTVAHVGDLYEMYLSQYVRMNYGAEQQMPKGYPMLVNQGSNNLFTVRWWKEGSTNIYSYDPIINAIAYPPSPASSSGPAKSLVVLLSVLLPLFCILYILFFGYWWFYKRKTGEETTPVKSGSHSHSGADEEKKSSVSTSSDTPYKTLPPE